MLSSPKIESVSGDCNHYSILPFQYSDEGIRGFGVVVVVYLRERERERMKSSSKCKKMYLTENVYYTAGS